MIDSRAARVIMERTRELAATLPGEWRTAVTSSETRRYHRELAGDFLTRAGTFVDCSVHRDACYYTRDSVRIETRGKRTLYFPADMLMLLLFHDNAVEKLELKLEKWSGTCPDLLDRLVLEVERMLAGIDPVFKRREVDILNTLMNPGFAVKNAASFHGKYASCKEISQWINLTSKVTGKYLKQVGLFTAKKAAINFPAMGLMPVLFIEKETSPGETPRSSGILHYFTRDGLEIALEIRPAGYSFPGEPLPCHDYSTNVLNIADRESRWGTYPGLVTSSMMNRLKKWVEFDHRGQNIRKPGLKDMVVLDQVAREVADLKDLSELTGVSSTRVYRQLAKMAANKIITPVNTVRYCGLNTVMLLALVKKEGGNSLFDTVKSNLSLFPSAETFHSEKALFSRIQMPSRWLNGFLHDMDDLLQSENFNHLLFKQASTRGTVSRDVPDFAGMIEATGGNGYSWRLPG